jgi:hypothetical protein
MIEFHFLGCILSQVYWTSEDGHLGPKYIVLESESGKKGKNLLRY